MVCSLGVFAFVCQAARYTLLALEELLIEPPPNIWKQGSSRSNKKPNTINPTEATLAYIWGAGGGDCLWCWLVLIRPQFVLQLFLSGPWGPQKAVSVPRPRWFLAFGVCSARHLGIEMRLPKLQSLSH